MIRNNLVVILAFIFCVNLFLGTFTARAEKLPDHPFPDGSMKPNQMQKITRRDRDLIKKWITFLRISGQTPRMSNQLRNRLNNIQTSLWTFNLPELYKNFPLRLPDKRRADGIYSQQSGSKLHYQRITKSDLETNSFPLKNVGAGFYWYELQTRKNSVYDFKLLTKTNIGEYDPIFLRRGYSRFLTWMKYPEVARNYWNKLEHTTQTLDFLNVRIERRNQNSSDESISPFTKDTSSRLYFYVDTQKLSNQYPLLAEHFQRMSEILNGKFIIYAEKKPVYRLSFQKEKPGFELELIPTVNGLKPIKTSRNQEPGSQQSINPFPVENWGGKGRLTFNLYLLKSKVRNIEFSIRQTVQSKYRMNWDWTTERTPEISYEGRLFGVVPPWLIDIVIPSNLNKIANQFVEVLMDDSENGLGGSVSLARITDKDGTIGDDNLLTTELGGKAIHNGTISFGLKIINQRIKQERRAEREFKRLLRTIAKSLQNDLQVLESN